MREQFSPLLGAGGKPFIFTDSSLIHGKDEYAYAQLSPIRFTIAPTPLTNGVAQVTANGKLLNLAYKFKERERFVHAMTYANEQIESANGVSKNYKYLLQAHTGTKLEVYEDSIILYFVPYGNVVASAMRGGSTGGKRLSYDIITAIQFMEPAGASVGFIQFEYSGSIGNKAGVMGAINDENSIPVSPQNLEKAREIVAFIEERRKAVKTGGQTVVNQQVSSADELLKFKQLLDSGVITQEEFDTKKKQLLGL